MYGVSVELVVVDEGEVALVDEPELEVVTFWGIDNGMADADADAEAEAEPEATIEPEADRDADCKGTTTKPGSASAGARESRGTRARLSR